MFTKTEKCYIILKKININANVKDGLKDWETDEMLNLRPWKCFALIVTAKCRGRTQVCKSEGGSTDTNFVLLICGTNDFIYKCCNEVGVMTQCPVSGLISFNEKVSD